MQALQTFMHELGHNYWVHTAKVYGPGTWNVFLYNLESQLLELTLSAQPSAQDFRASKTTQISKTTVYTHPSAANSQRLQCATQAARTHWCNLEPASLWSWAAKAWRALGPMHKKAFTWTEESQNLCGEQPLSLRYLLISTGGRGEWWNVFEVCGFFFFSLNRNTYL